MHRYSFFLLLICLAACSSSRKTVRVYQALDTISVSANNNPMNIYRASAPRVWDIRDTRVALRFNFADRTADGRAWIDIAPYCCTQDSIVLDAKNMQIDTVGWLTGSRFTPLPYRYNDTQLVIRKRLVRYPSLVDTTAPAGIPEERLYIVYKAMPYRDTAKGGSAAINDDRGLYFINADRSIPGKPVQIWTQGESESNSHWLPTIDKPNERFTTRIALTVPDSFRTLSNGAMVASQPAGNGLRTDTWQMDKPIQTYAIMFAIGQYAVIKDKWRGREVSYYVEPAYAPYARDMFRHTPEMLDYFSGVTGVEFPWNKYSQIVARDYVSGAMENTSASLFGEFANQNTRETEDKGNEDVVAHELFHQWFGDYVTFESWSNLTLSESFANYGEQLWRRHYYGDAWADELALDDLQKYLSGAGRADPELVRFHYRDREDMFDHISYNKGGAILNYMKGLMGDDLFSLSMNKYLTANALQSAEATQWRLAVEAATGKDWNWFFDQWYYRPGHPVLDIKYDYNDALGRLTVTVRQQNAPDSNKLYRLPLKAGIINGNQVTIEDWELSRRVETFTYPYRNGIRPVVVPDYLHWLPGSINEQKRPAQWLAQFRHTSDYISKRRAVSFAARVFSDSATKLLFAEALQDSIAAIRVHALNLLAGKPLQESLKQQVLYLAVQDSRNRVRAAAFSCLGSWEVKTLKQELLAAADDRSYAVAGAALLALYETDPAAAYSKAKALMATDPKADLERAVWEIVAKQATDTDLYIFRAQADLVYGGRRADLAGYLSRYLAGVNSDQVFEDGLGLLDKLFRKEQIISYKKRIFNTAVDRLGDTGSKNKPRSGNAAGKQRRENAKRVIRLWLDELPDKAINQARLDAALGAS